MVSVVNSKQKIDLSFYLQDQGDSSSAINFNGVLDAGNYVRMFPISHLVHIKSYLECTPKHNARLYMLLQQSLSLSPSPTPEKKERIY